MLQTVAANTMISAAARLLGGVFALVTIGIVTRALGPGSFGEYSAILAFLYLFSIAADLGLYQYLLRESSRPGVDESAVFSLAFTLRIAALTFILGTGIAAAFLFVPVSSAARLGIPLAAAAFWLQSLVQLGMPPFQKRLVVYWTAVAEVAARILQLALSAAVAYVSGSVVLFLGVLATSSLLQFLVQFAVLRRYLAFRLSFSFGAARHIVQESLSIAAGLLFTLIYFRLDTVMLSFFQPPEDVGIYNLSYKVLEYLIFFPAMFVGLVMPRLSREAVGENLAAFKKTLARLFDVVVFAAAPVLLGGLFLAPLIVEALGGSAFAAAAVPLRILLFATALIFLGTVFGSATIALGQQRKAMWVYAGGMVCNFLLNLIFIPRFSYVAAAASTVVTELFVTGGLLVLVLASAGGHIRLTSVLHAFLAAGIMALPFFSLRYSSAVLGTLALLPYLVVCPLIYVVALKLMRAIKPEHIALLRGKPGT